MIIYFEGLSCAGKTTLIDYISANTDEKIHTIKELPVDYSQITDIDNFCRENDEIKCNEANSKTKNKIVLVDRGYVSTLAYNYIQYKLDVSREYIKSLAWYFNGIVNKKLIKPDLYVFINLDQNKVESRAKKLNKFNKNIAWYASPKIGDDYYHNFFKTIEPEVPLLELDGTRPTEFLANEFWKKIDQIKNKV